MPVPHKYTASDYFFQFVTITVGVLIALLINGLVEWNNNRVLVTQARQTIADEIRANQKDLDSTLTGIVDDLARFDNAIIFANDMLTRNKTSVNELKLHLNLADLTAAGWHSAERTGALSHMPYSEVQRYSLLYDLQELHTDQQRALLDQLAGASAILSGDFNPDNPNLKDLEDFRQRVRQLRAHLAIHEQMARRLSERYAEVISRR
jgi:hypothetical protein